MRKFIEEMDVTGIVVELTHDELREQLSEVLYCVKYGKVFVITNGGNPVAVLSSIPGEQLAIEIDSHGNKTYTSTKSEVSA